MMMTKVQCCIHTMRSTIKVSLHACDIYECPSVFASRQLGESFVSSTLAVASSPPWQPLAVGGVSSEVSALGGAILALCSGRGLLFCARCASLLWPEARATGLAELAAGLVGFLMRGLLRIEYV